jgi:hypothetical protein
MVLKPLARPPHIVSGAINAYDVELSQGLRTGERSSSACVLAGPVEVLACVLLCQVTRQQRDEKRQSGLQVACACTPS